MTNPNEPAYPTAEVVEFKSGEAIGRMGGLTKREYFALELMNGLIASGLGVGGQYSRTEFARAGCQYADELIAALNKDPKP